MRDIEITISYSDLENYLKTIGDNGIRIEHYNQTLKGSGTFAQNPEVLAKDMWEQITKEKINIEKTKFELNKRYNYDLFKNAYSSVNNLLKYSQENKLCSIVDYETGQFVLPPYHPYLILDKLSDYAIEKAYEEGVMPKAIKIYKEAMRIIKSEVPDENKNKNEPDTTKGIVYLLKIKDKRQYKIGVTTNFDKRLKQISPKMPFELKVECKIEHNDIYGLENKLHNKFEDKRIKGEWFKLNEDDVSYIKSLD